MAYDYLTDEQLKTICNNNKGVCDCRCLECEAFIANNRYHEKGGDDDNE